MIIRELYIRNFGKFSEEHFYFHEGLQTVTGENEFGKSTLHAFIRAMLFGLERGRGRAAAKDDFTRYEPWENPGYYAGMMRFSCGGKTFRLERNFHPAMKRASLICEDDGEELSVEHGDLEMLLGGMTRELFDSTVSVGQLAAEPGQSLSEALENYAANYFASGGGGFDLAHALQILQDRKKETARALREEEEAQEKARDGLDQECRYLEQDMDRLKEALEEKKAGLARVREAGRKKQAEEREQDDTGNSGIGRNDPGGRGLLISGTIGALAGAAGLLWCLLAGRGILSSFFLPVTVAAGCLLAAGILLLAAGAVSRRGGKRTAAESRTPDSKRRTPDGSPAEEADGREEENRLRWDMERIRAEWKEKEIRRDNLREQWEESGKSGLQKKLESRIQALTDAEEELKKAAGDTGEHLSEMINRRVSEIVSAITEGRYPRTEFGRDGRISVWDGERRIPADRLSRGTVEQIYFAVRMAAADMLLEEPMPVILDDVFAFYDDKRLESALKWLSSQKKQVIIFTCHKREEELIRGKAFT